MKRCQPIKRIFKGIYNKGDKFEMISSLKNLTIKLSEPKTYTNSNLLNKLIKYSIFNCSVKCNPVRTTLNYDDNSAKMNIDKTNEYSNEIKEVSNLIIFRIVRDLMIKSWV